MAARARTSQHQLLQGCTGGLQLPSPNPKSHLQQKPQFPSPSPELQPRLLPVLRSTVPSPGSPGKSWSSISRPGVGLNPARSPPGNPQGPKIAATTDHNRQGARGAEGSQKLPGFATLLTLGWICGIFGAGRMRSSGEKLQQQDGQVLAKQKSLFLASSGEAERKSRVFLSKPVSKAAVSRV